MRRIAPERLEFLIILGVNTSSLCPHSWQKFHDGDSLGKREIAVHGGHAARQWDFLAIE